MPLVFRENVEDGAALGIWKLTEDVDTLELIYPLSKEEEKQYANFSHERRQKEWLASRILLTELLRKKISISYNENGKPQLKSSEFDVSLSHSKNFVAALISKQHKVGVDIEECTNRITKVRHKFLSPDEQKWCTNINEQTAIWSAKEAIYKVYEKDLCYQDAVCDPFALKEFEGNFKARIIKSGFEHNAQINYFRFEDDILCYLLK